MVRWMKIPTEDMAIYRVNEQQIISSQEGLAHATYMAQPNTKIISELYEHFLLLGASLFLVTLVLVTPAFTPTSPLSSAAALSR